VAALPVDGKIFMEKWLVMATRIYSDHERELEEEAAGPHGCQLG